MWNMDIHVGKTFIQMKYGMILLGKRSKNVLEAGPSGHTTEAAIIWARDQGSRSQCKSKVGVMAATVAA